MVSGRRSSAREPAPRRPARARELGQNFLVDRNIVDVIERLAELNGRDVVLEIGGGPGILSERLAERVGHDTLCAMASPPATSTR
jgi:16S rRNA A1518/A1519 N6-dimethyltransferase RsmA/KsgA/DIM1 with predicted DNA glycosylase/AP lyase activity